jgi:hypothetical protein
MNIGNKILIHETDQGTRRNRKTGMNDCEKTETIEISM